MAVGRAGTLTVPLAACTVTGNGPAFAADAGPPRTSSGTAVSRAVTKGVPLRLVNIRSSSIVVRRTKCARTGGTERTALPPRTGCVDPSQAAGLAPIREPHHCGTAPDSDRTSL